MPRIVVMGVAGAGKSVVGAALADALGLPFLEGDALHSAAARRKMAAGDPLDDADRAPWLEAIGAWLREREGVAACSALKRAYRDALRAAAPSVAFIHLSGDRETVRSRVAARPEHFMPASLIDSQFAALEPLAAGEPGLTLDLDAPVETLVAAALRHVDGG